MKFVGRWQPYLYLLPALVMFGLLTFYPIARTVQMSLTDLEFIQPEKSGFIGLDNYREALGIHPEASYNDEKARLAFANTLRFTAMFLPLYIILPMPIAFLIDRLRRQVAMRVATFLPVVVSGAVVAVLWTTLYHATYGPFTAIARKIGFADVNFLAQKATAMPSLVAMGVWHGMGFNVLLYLVRLAAIPDDLYEAAAVDGANRWQTFWGITVPLLRPAIYLVTVLGLIGSLKVFGPMFIMTDGGPANSTLSLVMYIYQTAFRFGNLRFGYAAAMAVILAIVIMTFAILSSRLNRPVDR